MKQQSLTSTIRTTAGELKWSVLQPAPQNIFFLPACQQTHKKQKTSLSQTSSRPTLRLSTTDHIYIQKSQHNIIENHDAGGTAALGRGRTIRQSSPGDGAGGGTAGCGRRPATAAIPGVRDQSELGGRIRWDDAPGVSFVIIIRVHDGR
jgi:hypothetical protein